ncbi:hypothetical protein NIES267_42180 [Calothrix parasitica NIES-267]|uniref:Uncharacterized protein n=1 Tax=Calothrix parasitica NIES-267 TaxID=1973488 RepID=A0A1Z4LU05_9CYAN|nr:hypothetical protein NIES267_42180 [Calothrix parasitica NIES-267]
MAIKLNQFDTKTKQDTGIEQKLDKVLAQYLFPNTKFSIGIAYPDATIPEDLEEDLNGIGSLQFSSGTRMFFADNPNIRSLLYPNPSDGAAYPLPFTPCQSFHELRDVRVLVIDDVTGENGNVIAANDARKLVGDCKGLIDRDFAISNNIQPRAFQFRLGIKPQQESAVMRIAKGTLAPTRLDKLGESSFRMSGKVEDGTLRSKIGYDMVLATSSFKGRKGEDAIKPGEYVLSLGLGVKSFALYREHSLGTQILVNYPQAVKHEITTIIKEQAEKLAQEQKDPKKLAQRYIENCSRRKALAAKSLDSQKDFEDDIEDKLFVFDNLISDSEIEEAQECENCIKEQKDLLLYSLLKADTENFYQLLEHPKIISDLKDFARKQWVEIATGRSIKFTSGLAQPSLDLQPNEICIPYLEEGKEIIVTRSPLINSNGVITLKNKHLPQTLSGCVYINPITAMENMQCDFDGDLLAFAPSKEFPILAEEVKQKNLPENRYPDIVKKAKVPYRGTFAAIAVSAMDNKIGIIANEIQKNIALQCEVDEIPPSEKSDYLQRVSANFNYVLKRHEHGKLEIPPKILNQLILIASILNKDLKESQLEHQLNSIKKILFDCVAELGNELQVATDGCKSALRPDESIIKYCQAITSYKEVEWLADKKNKEAFINRGMKTNGYSPIDLMIQQTNQIFEQNQLVARPIEQFRKLYPQIEFNSFKEQALQIKTNYNSKVRNRIELEERQKIASGPLLKITSPNSGKQLEITNLIKFKAAKNSNFWKASELSIKICSRKPTQKMPHPLFAQAKFKIPSGKDIDIPIGTISMKSMREHNLKPGIIIEKGKVEFFSGISNSMIDALKQQTLEYVESIRESTPDNEKLQLAAAIHDVSHTEENKNYSGEKKAGVAFAIFPDEVIGQLSQLQFTQMRVLGTQFNHYADRNFAGEKVPIKFENGINPRAPTQTARWIIVEGNKLGTIDASSPHLLPGYEAIAAITSPPSKSVIITSLKNSDNKLQIDNVNKYAFKSSQWQNEQANINLVIGQTNPYKAPNVFAKIGNQILGTVNKKSVKFLQGKLAAVGKSIQGFSFSGTLKNAPASYADIVIDPSTVKFPQIEATLQHDKNSIESSKPVCTVLFFEASVDSKFQQKTEQIMANMLKRSVERAVELGYSRLQFVDVSDLPTESSALRTIEQLAAEHKDINVDFVGSLSVEDAIGLMKEPSDIAIGIKDAQTVGIIDFFASHNMAIATYNPQTQKFDKRNLPAPKKVAEVTLDITQQER